jgi:hypothetical protein
MNGILTVRNVPKYLNCSTISKDVLPICMFPFCPAFWSRDTAIHLVSWKFIVKENYFPHKWKR